MRIVLIFLFFLLMYSCNSWALSRVGPPPTLYDFVDQADIVFVGRVSASSKIAIPSRNQPTTYRIEFEDAHYIDGEGIHAFKQTVYLYLNAKFGEHQIGSQRLYFLRLTDTRPTPVNQFTIRTDNSVHYYSHWDGGGIIQRIGGLGEFIFRTPYHSCQVLNPLFEIKQYECQLNNQTITTRKPEDTDPPLDSSELIELLIDYLTGTKIYDEAELQNFHDPNLRLKIIQEHLNQMETIDKALIEVLKTMPAPEKLLEGINQREQARGRRGDYKNNPELVAKWAVINAQEKLKREEQQRESDLQAAEKEAEQKRLRLIQETAFKEAQQQQLALEGGAIALNRSDASLSYDISTLPGCSQLWNSPDIPLKGDNYYIGNCVRVENESVCTFIADAKHATDHCTQQSEYVGGIITPPLQAFQNLDGPWQPEELQVLYHGAGMSAGRISVLRQPPNPPPLFIGTQATQWNLYLRQVKYIPDFVPDELR